MTSVMTWRSPVRVKEPAPSAVFLRESIRRLDIMGMKITLELFLFFVCFEWCLVFLGEGGEYPYFAGRR